MSETSRFKSQRAAPVPVDNPHSSNSLFPPYYPERTSSLPRSDTSESEHRSNSQASNIASSQSLLREVEEVREESVKAQRRSIWRKCFRFLVVLPRGWSIEYISCFISVAAFVSLVVVLDQYDNKSAPSWPLGITLNTLLAFLTAVSQTCFVFPVVQGLSQMKWNWFVGKDRPLADFESFDSASRGAWGSILLVFSTKGRLSVLLAAVILVTSAVTSTVTQSALSQNTRYIHGNGNATAMRMLNDKYLYMSTNDAMAVMMNAMYTAANATYDFDAPVCSTGNCQWPTFGSLAVCSQMNDITDQLSTLTGQEQCCWQNSTANKLQPWNWGPAICKNCTYSGLSNGLYLNYFGSGNLANTSNIWLSTSTTDNTAWSEVYSFSNESFADNALNAVQVVYLNSSDETYYNASLGLPNSTVLLQHSRAAEILFYLCAQTYDLSTINGTAVTTINATLSTVNDTQNVLVTSDNIHYTPYTNYTFILDGQNYSYYGINFDMGEMLNYFATGFYNYDVINGGLDVMTPFSYAVGNILYHNTDINSNSSTGRDGQMRQALSGLTSNMAKGLTNWLRRQGTAVQGEADVLNVYVVVRWNYLIFLGVQVVLSAAFLIWIIIDSRKRKTGNMKDSALATLLVIPGSDREYLDRQLSMTADGEDGMEQREKIEQGTRARLIQDTGSGDWHLRLVDHRKS